MIFDSGLLFRPLCRLYCLSLQIVSVTSVVAFSSNILQYTLFCRYYITKVCKKIAVYNDIDIMADSTLCRILYGISNLGFGI